MEQIEMQKVTAEFPKHLLDSAKKSLGGVGTTEALREGLKRIVAQEAGRELQKLRGKLKLDIDLKELREDRDLSRFKHSD